MDRLTLDRAEDLLERARTVRVLVVGDLMLDRYIFGRVERISPEAPVPVVHVTGESLAVGGAGNVAANVVALGARCGIVGCVGDDSEGAELLGALQELGVETDGVFRLPHRPTTVKTRLMARHQHVARMDREETGDLEADDAAALGLRVRGLAAEADALALEDYNKGVLVPEVIRAAMEGGGGAPVVVDPKRRRFFEYGGAAVFKPNARELEDALGEPVRAEDPAWLEEVRCRLGCDNLLLTLGEEGLALQSGREGYLRVPAVARDVYDVSGAGDTVTAVVAVALAAGASMVEAAILANHAAAVEVGKAGVAVVTPEEILEQHRRFAEENEST